MDLQRLLSYVRRACEEFNMIAPGDKIAVAVSGGKDSLAALVALAALKRFYPHPYTLTAITIDLGLPNFNTDGVAGLCAQLGIPYTVVSTNIGSVVFDGRREKNPCSLCAKMRKGALNAEALRMGCSRVAYGHNKDDIIHTFLLSLFYEGRINALEPVTYLDKAGLYLIRPLLYVPERDALGFARRNQLPVVKSPCPVDGRTKRAEIAGLVAELRKRYNHLDTKLFTDLRGMYK
jgi:tRNA(Ile)-lysidine synthase TilS/MesJ